MNKWKDVLEKHTKNGMKKENMIVFILLGVLLFIIAMPTKENNSPNNSKKSGFLDSKNEIMEKQEIQHAETAKTQTEEYADYLEKRLAETLSSMEAAGKVKVMVTVNATTREVVEKDHATIRSNTTETDSEGGSRNINNLESNETTLYTVDAQGNQIPYVIQVFEPEITGVVVVAQGAGKEKVNSDISEAIQALFGIEAHKIKIVKMKTE